MAKVYIKREGFEFIEKHSPAGGVTVDEFAKKFGIKKLSAASWLSKWTGANFLKHTRGVGRNQGRYYIDNSCIWWGSKVFDSERGTGE